MGTLTVRQLDDDVMAKLRVRAAQHGRSMEADAREVLAAVANGARILPNIALPGVDERLAEVQAMVRARLGELPKGRVDAFIAQRKAAAERGE